MGVNVGCLSGRNHSVELGASLGTLLFSVCPPSPPPPQSTALGAVPRLWHGHGMALVARGEQGDAGMSLSHDDGFPSRSVPNAQLLWLPGMGPAFCPAPSSGRALGSELRAKPISASPPQLFLTRLCFFQLDIFASLESTRRLQNVLSSSGFFN